MLLRKLNPLQNPTSFSVLFPLRFCLDTKPNLFSVELDLAGTNAIPQAAEAATILAAQTVFGLIECLRELVMSMAEIVRRHLKEG